MLRCPCPPLCPVYHHAGGQQESGILLPHMLTALCCQASLILTMGVRILPTTYWLLKWPVGIPSLTPAGRFYHYLLSCNLPAGVNAPLYILCYTFIFFVVTVVITPWVVVKLWLRWKKHWAPAGVVNDKAGNNLNYIWTAWGLYFQHPHMFRQVITMMSCIS